MSLRDETAALIDELRGEMSGMGSGLISRAHDMLCRHLGLDGNAAEPVEAEISPEIAPGTPANG